MKKIVQEEYVKKTTELFQAIDGTTFSSEEKCIEWETKLKTTISASWNKIPKGYCCESAMCFRGDYEGTFITIIPRNIEDIKIINMHTELSESEALTPDDIKKEIVINEYCGEYYKVDLNKLRNLFENGIKSMQKMIEEYGQYEVVATGQNYIYRDVATSYTKCIENLEQNIRRKLQSDKLDGMQIHLVITKDENLFKDTNYVIFYDQKIGYSSFRMEEIKTK